MARRRAGGPNAPARSRRPGARRGVHITPIGRPTSSRRAGTPTTLSPSKDDEFGQHFERYVFRSDDWMPNAPDRLVPNPHPFTYAVRRGIEETRSVIKFISVGLIRLVQGRVSL